MKRTLIAFALIIATSPAIAKTYTLKVFDGPALIKKSEFSALADCLVTGMAYKKHGFKFTCE